jgi:hypothetical protein
MKQDGLNGETWLDRETDKSVEVNPRHRETIVNIGCAQNIVYVNKMYGPSVAATVRVTLDYPNWEWVIEKEEFTTIASSEPGIDFEDVSYWVEQARFDANHNEERSNGQNSKI